MDWQDVLAQLNDLPSTFTRDGNPYDWWVNSFTELLSRYTTAADAYTNQINFNQANGLWLNVWGELYGISRHTDETDSDYSTRISQTLQAPHGPPLAIQQFLLLSLGITATVTEDIPSKVGWNVAIPINTMESQTAIAQDLDFVRPAGVPYNFNIITGGFYLTTVNYLGRARVTGAYLSSPTDVVVPNISTNTNNSVPLLPTTFLTSPIINPSLAG
jgi:hypothetical protein